ncbi:MAG: alpha/beta fold hydrolase [Ruminococcaceae bacterium]|nr:alpha/beta fold hydrolase [Oscillospiraceae bacterium]
MQIAFSLFVFVSAILCLVFVAGAFYVYLVAFRADHREIDESILTPADANVKIGKDRIHFLISDILDTPHEVVTIRSFDGLELCAKYYHHADGAPLDILFHGYRSASCRDCCGVFRISKDQGHNVLLVDQRAHGRSGGRIITFGIRERHDCLSWINYAVERFGKEQKIMLIGLSMGAATVLMASGMEMPRNVVGIISDSTYTSPRDIVLKVSRDRKYPENLVAPLAKAGAKIFGKFDLDETTAVDAVKNCKKPVLFLHGEDDFFVPCRMTRKVYAACASEKHLVAFHNNGHCANYVFNTERYVNEINKFSKEMFSR